MLVGLMVFMELVGAFISFLLGYYAMRAYRASSSRELLLLYYGFILLGLGMCLRAATVGYLILMRVFEVYPPLVKSIVEFAGVIYSAMQVVAYVLFVAMYILQSKRTGEGEVAFAAFPVLYFSFFNPFLELVAVVLLGLVTVQSFINWSLRRSGESFLVFLGFGFMLLGHMLLLFIAVENSLLFFGQLAQLAGFLCLLAMLVKVSRGGGE